MMHYKKAKALADRIVQLFKPHCEKIDIAGSIRREKEIVKDIEIVCLPKKEFIQTDLFGAGYFRVCAGFAAALTVIQSKVIKGNPEGRYMQLHIKGGGVLDLFMPQREDYYRQLAIRTGSADYSAFVLANAWKKKGWCGTHEGLRLQRDCTLNEKTGNWTVVNKNASLPPVWQNEEDFFAWLDVLYIHPKHREVKSSINIYQ
jgi:DNA polymerase/3'-5' exonuclease PolX